MKATLEEIYETYVAMCDRLLIEPMTFDRWTYVSTSPSGRVAFNKRK